MNLKNSENVWVLAGFLGVTAILAALILALVSSLTAEPIRQARIQNELKALKELNLPDFDNDMTADTLRINGVSFMAARKNGKITGFAAKTGVNTGYSGKVSGMVSFDTDGKILAVRILEHNETPGLGAAVCERKFQKTIFNLALPQPAGLPPNPVLDQFHGRNAADGGNWKISKDGGDLIFRTGATVSSRAVTGVVNLAAANFAAARAHFEKGENK